MPPDEEEVTEEETPEEETPEVDSRIVELEAALATAQAQITEVAAALATAYAQIEALSQGLIRVEGDVDQERREEPVSAPPSLLGILKSFS